MLKYVTVQQGRQTVEALEYTLYAFHTEKGTFTLVGSQSNGIDTFRELGTNNFYDWSRQAVYEWYKSGKIDPVQESDRIDWYQDTNKRIGAIKK